MKPKKTFKSLAELTAESIGVDNAKPDKAKAPDPQVLVEALLPVPIQNFPQVQNVQEFRGWGINEKGSAQTSPVI
jgi:hypothetical protein